MKTNKQMHAEIKDYRKFIQSIIWAAFKCNLDPDDFAAQATELLEKYEEDTPIIGDYLNYTASEDTDA